MKNQIYLRMCLLALVTCALTFWATLAVSYQTSLTRMETETLRQASIAAAGLEQTSDRPAYLTAIGKSDRSRVTWISADGEVLFDSNADPDQMENHIDRPEVQEALHAGEGGSTRTSATLGQQTYYAAILLSDGSVLRLSNATDIVTSDLYRAIPPLIMIAAAVLGLSMWFARRLTAHLIAPINALDLEQPLENDIYEEFSPLLGKIHTQNAQIEQQMALLRRRQIEFDAITANMSEGLVVLDDHLNILSVNAAAVSLLGAAQRAWTGENLAAFRRDPTLNERAHAAACGTKVSMELQNADGTHLQLYLNPVEVDEVPRGCVLLVLDVSARHVAERRRREFTANVSHELKTPLTSISGYAEMISLGLAKPADVKGFGEKIHKEAGRLLSLVDDIMKLSRLDESAASTLLFESVELYALCSESVERLRPMADGKQVTLSLEGAPVCFQGVRQMVSEAVFNLCENAIKYNREGGHVTVMANPAPTGGAQLTVSDTGIGIAPEEQERIFERFYRVDKSHSNTVGGTGLGLAIVKHICEIHSAALSVDSVCGQGSTFTIRFPS